jgi:murein DD-endopeptidase MepM/ murein hydrolase activator NlpD
MKSSVQWLSLIVLGIIPLLCSCSGMTKFEKSCPAIASCPSKPTKIVKSDLPVETELCSFVPREGKLCGSKTVKKSNDNALEEIFSTKKNHKIPTLAFPIGTGTLSSGFGFRRGVFHSGLDIAACKGECIKACAPGKVAFTGTRKGYRSYGQTVIVDHGRDVYTHYAHMSRISVRRGQNIASGDTIGLVGSTGRSTSPHLHLEVRVGPQAYNPMCYFKSDDLKCVDIAKSFTDTPMGPVGPRRKHR